MFRVPMTCPYIDEVIAMLEDHPERDVLVGKLEQLRELNKQLRYNANVWEARYNAFIFKEYEFNPEVLPRADVRSG